MSQTALSDAVCCRPAPELVRVTQELEPDAAIRPRELVATQQREAMRSVEENVVVNLEALLSDTHQIKRVLLALASATASGCGCP